MVPRDAHASTGNSQDWSDGPRLPTSYPDPVKTYENPIWMTLEGPESLGRGTRDSSVIGKNRTDRKFPLEHSLRFEVLVLLGGREESCGSGELFS